MLPRFFLFSCDSEPNTGPVMPSNSVTESVDPVEINSKDEATEQTTLGLIDTMHQSLAFMREYLAYDQTSPKKDDLREIAQTFVHDAGGYQDFTYAIPQ